MKSRDLQATGKSLLRTLAAVGLFALLASSGNAYTILLVTKNNGSLTSQESLRQAQFEAWGHTVTTVGAAESQANYDAALATVDVAYVTEEVLSTNVDSKLRLATVGVISEEHYLDDSLGFSTNNGPISSSSWVDVGNNTHPVSSGLASGQIQIFTSSTQRVYIQTTYAPGMEVLVSTASGYPVLAVIETGGALANTVLGNSAAAGRRVRLPWGGSSFSWSSLNSDGLLIAQQAIDWAAGGSGGGGGGLLLQLVLDETSGSVAADSSAYGHDGNYVNGVTLNQSGPYPGVGAIAASFDGANDHVEVTSTDDLNPTEAVSLSAWVRLDSTPTDDVGIIAKYEGAGDLRQYALLVEGQKGLRTLQFIVSPDGTDTNAVAISSANALPTGEWVHVVGVYDGGSAMRIYINGQLEGETTTGVPASLYQGTAPVWIGAQYSTAPNNLFPGSIHDARIYGNALSRADVAELYGLVGHWRLDESSGTTAVDSSLNENDGSHFTSVVTGVTGPDGELAASYNGSNRTEIAHGGDWNATNNAFSLATWVNIDDSDSHGLIVWSAIASPYALLVNSDEEVELRANWGNVSGESGNITHSSDGTIGIGQWHHVAITYDGSTVRFYIDGQEDTGSLSTSVTIGTSTDEMQLGGDGGSGFDLDGSLHDARVYNRAISSDEITQIVGSDDSTGVRITRWVEIATP